MQRIDLAMNLIDERERLGYSRKNFAAQTGVSSESLRLYESGQVNIPADFLIAAAQLGVDVQFLLTGIHSENLEKINAKYAKEVEKQIHKTNIENQINGDVNNSVIASSGAVVHQINTPKHITKTIAEVKPGEEHIDNAQASKLQDLVKKIEAKEKLVRKSPKSFRAIWSSLNSYCKVPKYNLIAKQDFEKAETYLRRWLGRLGSTKTARKNDPEWRNTKYAYIKINIKKYNIQDWFSTYLNKNFSVDSITDLDDDDLQKAYSAVSTKIRK